jgi:LuxR family maltose regulon positive regulatory protein
MAVEHLRVSPGKGGPISPTLIDARFRAPIIDHGTILARPRLEQESTRLSPGRVSLVIAPAGYGKTTAIAIRARAANRTVAWLSLEPRDNHLRRLEDYLLGAIGTVIVHDIQPAADGIDPTEESVAQHILSALHITTDPLLVVLDDLHHLVAADVLEALRIVIDYAPANVSFLLASRTAPPLPLSRWRARGMLEELHADDLRFTLAETRVLCAQWLPEPLTHADLELLVTSTQGWAAALRLIIMRLRQESPDRVSATLAELTASHRQLTDFLDDEILQSLPFHLRTMMKRTSILDPLCDDLCAYVLGYHYQPGALGHLWRNGALISPIDEETTWYRYHPLFARLLQHRLTRTHTTHDIANLHTRASQWWERNGHPARAVDHAILAGDWSRASLLISPLIATLEATHQLDLLRTWFDALPSDIVNTSPEFSHWYAWTLVRTGQLDVFEPHLANAEQTAPAIGVSDSIRAVAAFYRGDGPACIAHALSALKALPPEATVERLRAEAALGLGESHTGRAATARTRLDAFQTASTGSSAMRLDTEVQAGWVMLMTGETAAARQRLTRVVEQHATERSDAIRRALVMLADIRIEAAEYETARDLLRAADDRATHFGAFPLLADSRLRWARLHHREGDLDGAIACLASMSSDANVVGNLRVQTQIGAHLAMLWMDQGRMIEADRWVHSRQFEVTRSLEFIDEAEYPAFARWLMEHGRLEDARTVAAGLCASAQRDGRDWHLGQHLALLAMIQHLQIDDAGALSTARSLVEVVTRTQTISSLAMHGTPLLNLMRSVATEEDHLRLVQRLESVVDPRQKSRLPGAELPRPLSQRELDVLRLIEIGYSNRAISEHLFIAIPTVKRHLTNIFHKLGAASRTDAIHKARRQALI